MTMKTLIKILCFISFLFAEDVYPYFSNPEKQFEFEKVRIYVEEVEEKEMLISGGAQFNFGYLVDSNQPITIPSPIKTDYKYSYKFEIKQNNQLINEQDFLIGIGLQNEAKAILSEQTKLYFNSTYNVLATKLDTTYYEIIDKKKNYELDYFWIGYSLVTHSAAQVMHSSGSFSKEEDLSLILLFHGLGLIADGVLIEKYLNRRYNFSYKQKTLKDFKYKQSLSNQQIISLSESFNKKVYEQIKSK